MKTGAEAIRALATQLPSFRQKLSDGWYQVRIAGRDVSESGVTAQLHEPLPDGAVIHIVPRLAGAKHGGIFQTILGAVVVAVAWWNPAGWLGAAALTGMYAAGASMILGGIAQMLTPAIKTPSMESADNGKQNTFFSSLDNMIAQGNPLQLVLARTSIRLLSVLMPILSVLVHTDTPSPLTLRVTRKTPSKTLHLTIL